MDSTSRIALRAQVEPAVWPAGALTDVRFRLVLINEGERKAAIYPGAARLSDVSSVAGAGISWQLRFRGAGGPVHQQEMRSWYGPPGEPPSASAVKKQTEVRLRPSGAHETELFACWIPNALLSPRHLDPAALDPTGMDNIAEHEIQRQWPSHLQMVPPLARRIPLHQASLLVFRETAARLEPLMAARPDFLRASFSTVVAFFVSPGDHELEAAYLQHSWMDIGEALTAEAPITSIRIAAAERTT